MSTRKLPPGVDLLPSGKFRVRVHVGGGKYRSKSFTRQRDAEKWKETMQVAKETGRVEKVDADLQTLAALAAEHMTASVSDLAPSTVKVYRNLWKAHVHGTPLASMTLRALDAEAIEGWLKDRRAAGAGEASIRKTMVLMQTVLERAVRFGRIQVNPVRLVKKPSGTRTISISPILPAQVESIRARLTGADAVLVSVLAYGGLRPGEALGLRWGSVRQRTIVVDHAVSDGDLGPTKTGATRSVTLLGPLRDDLAAWRTVQGDPADGALIFPRADGSPWTDDDWRNWRGRKFGPAAVKAGVQIGRPYDLRHSAASLWLQEGVNPIQVAVWMGHAPSMLLSTYAHVIADVDPSDRTSAEDRIAAARRDIPVTWGRVQASPTEAKRPKQPEAGSPVSKRGPARKVPSAG